ncbi:MAG: DEAD/DEAH box helicase family protein [Gemmatimonadota bacterium]|nr:DEAD/DEAH box helicase family protein [Gemmatimonadota bacterium]
MSIHKEISFEAEICTYLSTHSWLYAEGDAAKYDRARALFPEDVLAWVQEAHPAAWGALHKSHGSGACEALLSRLRDQLNTRGTLDVLRHGIEMMGLKARLPLAQFRPAMAANDEILARYAANRLRVVRQVHHSVNSPKESIDLVLFLNGVPVATAELKTDFTQSVKDAVDQYRFDRLPKPAGKLPEPLLSFPGGALVHFAVSNHQVQMTTKLEGPGTRFLPFDRGNDGGKGNAPNPHGHPTSYLWEQIWARDGWLEILGRYMVAERDKKKEIARVLFPRYHQLAATRALVAAVRAEGPGGRYLIQHSAGSGKTNSIAWTAHLLSDLHDEADKKVFDTVLVVSDRNVIDTQLQEAIFAFERTTGVVATIKGEGGSKSGELAGALSGGKKIVVCTIQTFPFALAAVRELAATQGKRFAVIADEAHSSQTGETAKQLRAVLTDAELAELEEGGEASTEDLLAAQMAARAAADGITYVAFTATPKPRTLELFGTLPAPTRKPAADNVPHAFHVYSMRQAIEEGFILDVLQNYTSYKMAFRLAHGGKEMDDQEVERSTAMKGIMGWIRLHPYNIAQKVQVVVEHFRELVSPLLGGRAKAMVVVGSRVEAVRWQLAIDKYIKEHGYPLRTLVAFSGEVNDPDSGPEPFSERSATLNPDLKGRDIRDAFHTDEYQILLVANKFQTGFDEPLLCGMYVDRRLAGIQAVQTLSRLNRAHPGKDTTYVVDFANEPAEILEAFQTYYTTAHLADVTDPNLVFDLRAKLDSAGHYDDHEVERVVNAELKPGAKQGELVAAIEPVVDRLLKKYRAAQDVLKAAQAKDDSAAARSAREEMEALQVFRGDLGAFVRLYTYLSQIFDYGNTEIEKRAIFFRRLLPLLDFGREREGIDLSQVVLTHHTLKSKGAQPLTLQPGVYGGLTSPTGIGTGKVQERQKAYLSEIIEKVNDLFSGELSEQDKLVYVNNVLKGKLLESDTLVQQAASNSKEQFANSPDLKKELLKAIMDAFDAHTAMSTQALNSESVQRGLQDILLNHADLYESLRKRAA